MTSSSHPPAHGDFLSAEIYQEIFVRANDAILIFRPHDELILEANPRAEEMYGYAREELVGMSLKKLTLNVPRGEEEMAKLLASGRYENFETQHRRRNGTVLSLECNASVIRFHGNMAVLVILRDVSDVKRVEEELRQRTAYLSALVEENPLGIVVLDRQQKVTACNRTFTKIFQWTEPEIANRNFDEIIAPEDLQLEARSLTQAVTEGLQSFRITTRRKRKDQTLADVEVMGVPLIIDGRMVGSFGLYQDISDRVSLQQQLLESQKMEAIGRLAGGVAHDLNNMLTAITIHSQLLQSKLSRELQQHTSQICLATERASATVQQLLAFSRKQAAFPKVIPLNTTITELMGMLRPLIREELELNFVPYAEELHVQIDPSHLAQVLVNLVVNARDAIANRGTIFLRTSARKLASDGAPEADLPAGDYGVIEVLDTGSGMLPEIKARIFEPFYTTKDLGKGTGLGLSTVYGIVKQNKGSIEVWSKVGQGSSFQIMLPLQKPAKDNEVKAKQHNLPGGIEIVLLVEDEDTARGAMAEFLENLGYEVLQAANGRDALAIYTQRGREIRLVVSDLIMPHLNGAEMAQAIWKDNPKLPVIFVSAYGDDDVRAKLPDHCRFFQKPFRLEHVAKAMRDELDKKGK
jgi:two-component system cell cycle sensor histidine kinase/response regulator CckA